MGEEWVGKGQLHSWGDHEKGDHSGSLSTRPGCIEGSGEDLCVACCQLIFRISHNLVCDGHS